MAEEVVVADTESNEGRDLIELLLEDHAKAKSLLEQIDDSGDSADLATLFPQLVKDLVTHEVAEEEIVYPALRSWVEGGDALAEARVAEQQEAEELLAAMEKMEIGSGMFRQSLLQLKGAVLDHAAHEEAEVFPALKAGVSPERLQTLGQAYTIAKAVAPTHPHPHAPNSFPGNVLVGPAIAIVDRAYDALRSVLQKVGS
jgi:hemerythrin superfamily protein